ncbi:MAG: LapA family protein [Burkholderiaceae bacterium]|nr:LapA family protein [Burkholderiaceae bacterium]MDH3461448.1 LapA family protein [Burkholderiaceae bacterium]
MRVRTLIVILLLLSVAGFVAINWSAFMTPTTLTLLLATVDAPVGLVMLLLLVLVVLAFAVYMAVWQGQILLESRRQAKESQALRTLAEQAEASRFTDLRTLMHDELDRLSHRVAQAQDALRTEVRDSANSLAATIGELDDRLQRARNSDTPG